MNESESVYARIKEIIEQIKKTSTANNISELEQEIIYPTKRLFIREDLYEYIKNPHKETIDLWVIIEDKKSGYRILYDNCNDDFGLGILGNDGIERFIGVKGSLLYVYNAM